MEVGRDNGVEALRPERHAYCHGVDQHLVPGDIREFLRDLVGDLVPHHHAMPLRVRFGNDGEEFSRARLRQLERVAHDALDADAGENRDLRADFLRQPAMHPPAAAGIFAFGVFAHDHPVEIAGADMAQRRGDAGQDPGRPDVGVLVKALADRQAQAPQRDVVGNIGRADRAEIDRVEFLQRGETVGRHHHAVLAVIGGTPIEGFDVELHVAEALLQAFERLNAGGDDLGTDPVGRNGRD